MATTPQAMTSLRNSIFLGIAIFAFHSQAASVQPSAGSPVADAAMRGDPSALRSLLEKKIDVNAPQPDGATAIQWAAYRNDLAMADALIAAGADVKRANND